MLINYAHRGASAYYPENTMIAFEKSIELGATGIETDVQMTKDGVLILIHDETINRTTNDKGFVKDFTYEELRNLDAGSWFSDEFKGIKIPPLKELMDFLQDKKNIKLNIELKNNIIIYDKIEEKVIKMIYEYGMQDRIILSSFNHYTLRQCKKISKKIKIGLLYTAGLYQPEKYARRLGAEALHPYFYAVNSHHIIKRIKKSGIMLNPYTIDEEKDMKRFIDLNVDGIITNYPDKLKNILLN
ncbi:glycerophosphodiester phosphodiesterase [Clostridium aestuarii]|uniref:Glycerophosphodiester phosphodiesterase n=1 Tax=Clostridium aestuarii TaxID=338193 RepID=A0ABT4CWP6_9CLOT|nr:glycerophosphodiester phosphodiesterase [Clostridium aestuarii]MCY6483418.1 glycerophosphodiester phosphodiesterase [Clostridium aestuarii]